MALLSFKVPSSTLSGILDPPPNFHAWFQALLILVLEVSSLEQEQFSPVCSPADPTSGHTQLRYPYAEGGWGWIQAVGIRLKNISTGRLGFAMCTEELLKVFKQGRSHHMIVGYLNIFFQAETLSRVY